LEFKACGGGVEGSRIGEGSPKHEGGGIPTMSAAKRERPVKMGGMV